MMEVLLIKLVLAGIVFFVVLNFAGFHTWVERKQSALIQDRIGANRADIFGFRLLGLFHGIADAVKLFTKEDIVPAGADKTLHILAPLFSVFFALVAFAAIPFGDRLILGDTVVELQVAKIDAALLYVFAMLSLGVYGVILAGFASRNNYAIMGGLRATAQMISYEIALGMAVVGVIMVYGTMDLSELVRAQGQMLGGWIPMWGIVLQPVASVIFLTAALAHTKRLPFDLPEGESEIIGYFVEYSGMKFGMFFLTDFLETIMVACLATTLFFGGWQVPYLMTDGFHFPWGAELLVSNWLYVLLGVMSFSIKVVIFSWVFMQLRWTLPRFRYDQLMSLGWKGLFPIAVGNIVLTAVVLVLFGEAP
ncbi:NADH-quinone oxidoreductase subunit H [Acidobacteria bacterium AH-259-D05]|nr:NADH-quinone oxidoreductase subunit H [Acidobacteria bacterium AH-259-D05]